MSQLRGPDGKVLKKIVQPSARPSISNVNVVGKNSINLTNITVAGQNISIQPESIAYLDVDTAGVAESNKAVVVDSNNNIQNIGDIGVEELYVNGARVTGVINRGATVSDSEYMNNIQPGIVSSNKIISVDEKKEIKEINLEAKSITYNGGELIENKSVSFMEGELEHRKLIDRVKFVSVVESYNYTFDTGRPTGEFCSYNSLGDIVMVNFAMNSNRTIVLISDVYSGTSNNKSYNSSMLSTSYQSYYDSINNIYLIPYITLVSGTTVNVSVLKSPPGVISSWGTTNWTSTLITTMTVTTTNNYFAPKITWSNLLSKITIAIGNKLYVSDDGTTWAATSGTIPVTTAGQPVIYHNSYIAAFTYASNIVYFTTDGINWSSKTFATQFAPTTVSSAIIYEPELDLIFSNNNKLLASTFLDLPTTGATFISNRSVGDLYPDLSPQYHGYKYIADKQVIVWNQAHLYNVYSLQHKLLFSGLGNYFKSHIHMMNFSTSTFANTNAFRYEINIINNLEKVEHIQISPSNFLTFEHVSRAIIYDFYWVPSIEKYIVLGRADDGYNTTHVSNLYLYSSDDLVSFSFLADLGVEAYNQLCVDLNSKYVYAYIKGGSKWASVSNYGSGIITTGDDKGTNNSYSIWNIVYIPYYKVVLYNYTLSSSGFTYSGIVLSHGSSAPGAGHSLYGVSETSRISIDFNSLIATVYANQGSIADILALIVGYGRRMTTSGSTTEPLNGSLFRGILPYNIQAGNYAASLTSFNNFEAVGQANIYISSSISSIFNYTHGTSNQLISGHNFTPLEFIPPLNLFVAIKSSDNYSSTNRFIYSVGTANTWSEPLINNLALTQIGSKINTLKYDYKSGRLYGLGSNGFSRTVHSTKKLRIEELPIMKHQLSHFYTRDDSGWELYPTTTIQQSTQNKPSYKSMCYSRGIYAICSSGKIFKGRRINKLTETNLTGGWNFIAAAKGVFVVVGNNAIAVSVDRTNNWVQITGSSIVDKQWNYIHYSTDLKKWVACANNAFAVSIDAVNWNVIDVEDCGWKSVKYMNGHWLAVGLNKIAYCLDTGSSTNLVFTLFNLSGDWRDSAFGGQWILTGRGKTVLSLGYNSLTEWETQTELNGKNFNSVIWVEGLRQFFLAGQSIYSYVQTTREFFEPTGKLLHKDMQNISSTFLSTSSNGLNEILFSFWSERYQAILMVGTGGFILGSRIMGSGGDSALLNVGENILSGTNLANANSCFGVSTTNTEQNNNGAIMMQSNTIGKDLLIMENLTTNSIAKLINTSTTTFTLNVPQSVNFKVGSVLSFNGNKLLYSSEDLSNLSIAQAGTAVENNYISTDSNGSIAGVNELNIGCLVFRTEETNGNPEFTLYSNNVPLIMQSVNNGTVVSGKACKLDSNKDLSGVNTLNSTEINFGVNGVYRLQKIELAKTPAVVFQSTQSSLEGSSNTAWDACYHHELDMYVCATNIGEFTTLDNPERHYLLISKDGINWNKQFTGLYALINKIIPLYSTGFTGASNYIGNSLGVAGFLLLISSGNHISKRIFTPDCINYYLINTTVTADTFDAIYDSNTRLFINDNSNYSTLVPIIVNRFATTTAKFYNFSDIKGLTSQLSPFGTGMTDTDIKYCQYSGDGINCLIGNDLKLANTSTVVSSALGETANDMVYAFRLDGTSSNYDYIIACNGGKIIYNNVSTLNAVPSYNAARTTLVINAAVNFTCCEYNQSLRRFLLGASDGKIYISDVGSKTVWSLVSTPVHLNNSWVKIRSCQSKGFLIWHDDNGNWDKISSKICRVDETGTFKIMYNSIFRSTRDGAYGKGLYVVPILDGGNSNKIMYSDDGINWRYTFQSSAGIEQVIYVSHLNTFVCRTGRLIYSSPDGINWSLIYTHPNVSAQSNGMVYSEERQLLVLVFRNIIADNMLTTSDLTIFNTYSKDNHQYLSYLCYSPEADKFIFGSEENRLIPMFYTTDFTTFANCVSLELDSNTILPLGRYMKYLYSSKELVVRNIYTGKQWYSTDAVNWKRFDGFIDYNNYSAKSFDSPSVFIENIGDVIIHGENPDGPSIVNISNRMYKIIGAIGGGIKGNDMICTIWNKEDRKLLTYKGSEGSRRGEYFQLIDLQDYENKITKEIPIDYFNKVYSDRKDVSEYLDINNINQISTTSLDGGIENKEDIIANLNTWRSVRYTTSGTSIWQSVCWSSELKIAIAVGISGTGKICVSYDLANWSQFAAPEDTNSWRDICWSPQLSLFVAVASTGTNRAMTSSDGINWTARSIPNAAANWVNVCWSSDLSVFVAVSNAGAGNKVATSVDGINWTLRASANDTYSWNSVCWSPQLSLFVAVTGSDNSVMTSPDGINWTLRKVPTGYIRLVSVCWSPDLNIFVACSDGTNPNRIIISKDGINWQPVFSTEANAMGNNNISWNSVLKCFFISCQSGTNKSLVSYNGLYWFNFIPPNDTLVNYNCSCPVPEYNMQIMVGSANSITTFTNNKFNIKYTPSFKDVKVWNEVYWCNDLSLFIGFEGSTGQPTSNVSKIHTSSDGVLWQSREIHNNFNTWNNICWSPQLTRLVAVSSGGIGAFAYSSNGVNWNAANNTTLIDANSWRGVCWSPELNLFVAVAFAGTNRVATSPDGINWTLRASATEANSWRSVCWSSSLSLFVAVANSGTNRVMTSPDGITWTARASASETVAWNTICWSPQLTMFVAVGSSGIMTSINGTTFNLIANVSVAFSMVKWIESKNMFMASISSTTSNLLYFSTDGIVWKAYAAKSNQYISSFDYSPSSGKLVVVGSAGASYFSHIDNYEKLVMTTATINMDSNSWSSSCWSASLNLFVAVANTGTNKIATSSDGFNWTLRAANPDASTWRSICWSPELNLFVAVASAGTTRLMTSSDGITWTVRTPSSNTNNWENICWSSELTLFVAVASAGTNRVMTSTDGITWTARTSAVEANSWIDVCWSSELTLFVAVASAGTNRVMTSTDGITWTARTSAVEANSWTSVCWSQQLSLFVVVANTGTNRIMTSSNGINWKSSGATSVTDTNAYIDIIYASGLNMLIACGSAGTDRIIVSFDGINWYKQSSLNDTNSWSSLTYSNSLNRAICLSSNGTNRVMALEDKQLPTVNVIPNQSSAGQFALNLSYPSNNLSTGMWMSVCRSDELNLFVSVSQSGTNGLATSIDGINWTVNNNLSSSMTWQDICWSKELGIFVAIAYSGTGNKFAYSYNGISWTLTSSGDNAQSWTSVCWSPELNIFVAISQTSRVSTSSDGINWILQSNPVSGNWISICWSPDLGIFVAVSNGSTGNNIAYSSNAINWTATRLSTYQIQKVRWSKELGIFVAVGINFGSIMSSDGINWTLNPIGTVSNNNWEGLIWIKRQGVFVATCRNSTTASFAVSFNGINWTSYIGVDTSASWMGIAYSDTLDRLVITSWASTTKLAVMDCLPPIYTLYNYLSTNTVITRTASDYNTESKTFVKIIWAPELSIFVAVKQPIIMYSFDGNNWLPAFNDVTNNLWKSVCWSPELNLFVAVATTGSKKVARSFDGVNWTTGLSSDETSAWQSVCWSADLNLFVAIAFSGTATRTMTSTDGINWVSRNIDVVSTWAIVRWVPSLSIFVAGANGGTNKIATSTNGTTWTLRTTPSSVFDFDYSQQLSRFVSVGGATAGIMYSNDGITWIQSVNVDSTINTLNYYNVIWVSQWNMFIATCAAGLAVSSDGIRWYRRGYTLSAVSPLTYCQTTDKVVIALDSTNMPFLSLTFDMINIILPYEVKWDLTWNKSMQNFLAIKNRAPLVNDKQLFMSKDGYVWNFNSTMFSTTLSRLNQINSICDIPYTDTTVIAKNAPYIQALSGIGAVEQIVASPISAVFYSHTMKCILACFDSSNVLNTYFVSAAGQAGNLITSFTLPTSITIGQIFMCNGNHIFVPKNNTNSIYVSRDLNTFTTISLPSASVWKFDERIIRGHHKRAVGVSSSGLIIYSDDGIAWNSSTTTFSAGTRSFTNVRYITAFDIFIACDIIPKTNPAVYSSNGLTWNSVSLSTSNIMVNDVAFSPLSDNFIFIVREANADYWGIITTLPKLANSNNVIRYDIRHPTANISNTFNLNRKGGFITNSYSGNTFSSPNAEIQPLLAIHSNSAYKPTTSAWTVQSDSRLKENIVDADLDRCLEIVDSLDLKHYKWKDEFLEKTGEVDKSQLGWIAQEVEEVMPKAVVELGDMFDIKNLKTLNKDQIIAVLYGAVQKLIERYEILDKELKEL